MSIYLARIAILNIILKPEVLNKEIKPLHDICKVLSPSNAGLVPGNSSAH